MILKSLPYRTCLATIAWAIVTAFSSAADPPEAAQPPGDDYDLHYQLRIRQLEEQLAIYASATDAASAGTAAKSLEAMFPLENEILTLGEALGLPTPERQKELDGRYSRQIGELSTEVMKVMAEKSRQPWFRPVSIAQLRNMAAHGDEDAQTVLDVLRRVEAPVAPGALVKSWMKKAEQVAEAFGELDPKEAASPDFGQTALAMCEELKAIDAQMREAGTAVADTVGENDERIRTCMTGLLNAHGELSGKSDDSLSPDLRAALIILGNLLKDK